MNDMKQFFMKNSNDIIQSFIQNLKENQKTKNRLFIISVLCAFSDHQKDWKNVFPDVYKKFGKTHFLANQLSEKEKEYITSRYVEEVVKLWEEVSNAI